ncbi:large ribosomal subunit protein mL43-like [Branchiostoma lanceolatum]|uniref:Large ribosomal subunit protein mL43 n=1 Tax=Branchiostoma lanceolatum TaxID=7740 RepID=A0A8J9Z2U1_BRALA|nr:MRPL43 [Branchiostoma lanceolatum]
MANHIVGATGRTVTSGFLKSVLQNGVGRYVCQLQRITLKFCKASGQSRGVRDYVENHLLDFAAVNPGVVVYVTPKPQIHARVVAEYLNGEIHTVFLDKKSAEEIQQHVQSLVWRSGQPLVRLRKTQHTENPSIQGQWTPFTNRPSNTTAALEEKLKSLAK